MELSKRNLKWINNNSDLFDFDMDNAMATVYLHYASVDEVVDNFLRTIHISEDVLLEIRDVLDRIPSDFKVNYVVTIDDYGEYNKDEVLAAFYRSIDELECSWSKKKHKMSKLMGIYLVVGILVAIILVITEKFAVFKFAGPIFSGIMVVLIDVRFELFFEEGFSFFAINNPKKNITYKKFKRINEIIFN